MDIFLLSIPMYHIKKIDNMQEEKREKEKNIIKNVDGSLTKKREVGKIMRSVFEKKKVTLK